MDKTIDKSIQMDSQMKEFFECIGGDADTQQQRIQCIRNGLAVIADRLRLGKAEITVDIPKNRFMPLGERSSAVLYEEDGAELGTPVDIEMKIRTGWYCVYQGLSIWSGLFRRGDTDTQVYI